jgi:hypothetical protein
MLRDRRLRDTPARGHERTVALALEIVPNLQWSMLHHATALRSPVGATA